MNRESVRSAIVSGLNVAPAVYTSAVVDELERRVVNAQPDRPLDFAFIIARNWAITEVRNRASAARRSREAVERAEAERRERELEQRCTAEFDGIVRILTPSLTPMQERQIRMLRIVAFERGGDEACRRLCQDVTRDVRYQWKRRGLKRVLPHASQELRAFLTRGCKPRP